MMWWSIWNYFLDLLDFNPLKLGCVYLIDVTNIQYSLWESCIDRAQKLHSSSCNPTCLSKCSHSRLQELKMPSATAKCKKEVVKDEEVNSKSATSCGRLRKASFFDPL